MGKTNIAWKIITKFFAPEIKCYEDGPKRECEKVETGWIPLYAYIELIKYSMKTGELHRTMKFIIIGAIGTVLNLFFLYLLDPYVGSEIAGVLSTLITIVTNFVLNDIITFRDMRTKHIVHRFIGYVSVGIVGKILQIIIYVVLDLFMNPYFAMIIAIGITYFFRFFTIRDKVYK